MGKIARIRDDAGEDNTARFRSAEERRDAFVEQLNASALGAIELLSVYIGDRLGLYRTLAERGPSTPKQLAAAAGVHARYVREWLEQQAMSGILETENPDASDSGRRYGLPPGHDEVLLDEQSLNFTAPMAQFVVGCTRPLDAVLEAFRTGGGVPFEAYGADLHESQARMSRVLFDNLLADHWLPAIPEINDRLQADPPARVADLACGLGRSSLAMARGYPKIIVDGIDLDKASIERARDLLAASGLADRVSFQHADAADPRLSGRYDVVTIFEALHDMSYPVDALSAARGMLTKGGCMLIAEENTAERFSPDAGEHERLLYAISMVHCLPVGMVGDGAAGTGTVIRADTVRQYATEAGFASVTVLPIEHDEWRFYLLRP